MRRWTRSCAISSFITSANQQGALRELYRVLAPGGYLFLSESCESFINTWTVRWFFRHPPGVQRPAEGYVKLVREAGFQVDDAHVRTYTPWWSLWDFGLRAGSGSCANHPMRPSCCWSRRKGAAPVS